ncbi:MAG: MG2 domain-containing protein, partial [Candidatus Cloacimonas sp.]|nr:MG2 domain-containing protein [Candidatus Cloacimonas sp.]
MNPKLILLILACGLTVCLGAVSSKASNYDSAWKEIDKLQNAGLPKSMAVKVDSLYAFAVKENKVDQQIRALIYQLKIQQQIEEFSAQKAIDKVKTQLDTAVYPASAIMHSMLAQLYWSYYQSNRWRFSQRSETVNFKLDDIATWDLKTISKETINEYQISLQKPAELQKQSIADYPAFVTQGSKDHRLLRPTLYDFLAYRALEFYQNDESGLTLPFEEFSITDTKYFQSAAGFAKMTICTPDSLSLKYQAALLYQDLISFHLQDNDPSALVVANLERLEFMYNNCWLPQPEQYYEAALRLEISRYEAYEVSAYASFKLAALYNSFAGKYNADISETYRWFYKDAADICQQAADKHPDSFGGQSCKALMQNIRLQDIKLTAESYVITDAPIKVLLSAKNLSGVKLSIYRIPQASMKGEYYNENSSWYQDDYKKIKAMQRKKPLWTKTYEITNEGDYRSHSYELPLNSLPTGRYIIIASNIAEKDIADDKISGYCFILSTGISYVSASNATNTMLLTNRKTGEPIEAASLKVYQQDYNKITHNYYYKLTWSGTSDARGLVSIPIDNDYRRQRITIQSGSDSLNIFDYYSSQNEFNLQQSKRCLLFTDRSIYRPGQTIYLKGVMYESDGEKYNKLVPATSIEVIFYDVNYQVISRQTLQTNEYGTFNCTFTAPKNVLTGLMRIQTNWGSTSFSVEEYKRPRFEVTFDKPQETFKLNQDVTVKGKAMSYAGFPIDNAQVSYRILRQPKYPYWFWWWGPSPSSEQKEIAHGQAQTDEKGEFTLTFLAAGDDTVLSSYNPYFMFTISAD